MSGQGGSKAWMYDHVSCAVKSRSFEYTQEARVHRERVIEDLGKGREISVGQESHQILADVPAGIRHLGWRHFLAELADLATAVAPVSVRRPG